MSRPYDKPGSPMHGWPLHRRETGLLEAQCPHGVGHPIPESVDMIAKLYKHERWVWESHGCDGCCAMPSTYKGQGAVHYYAHGEVGEYQLHWDVNGNGSIWSFEVYPQHQRQGHAKAMMWEIIKRFGRRPLSLLVKRGNVPAIELYRQFGFEITAIDELRDEYLMRRKPNE